MKWIPTPSISVRNWGSAFSRSSSRRQSYPVRQYSQSSRTYSSGAPCSQSGATSGRGQRVRAEALPQVLQLRLGDLDPERLDRRPAPAHARAGFSSPARS